ncbi:MAG TPA: hypothetical protein VGS97_09450 [Actinocrinis sp.]|uniref:hypothetical protein n=1 Tax=Actinocrinis sp. TaxID=1920516 RepID=UPI002DDCE38E|nr:hypothetical protein [Actinocrinis sp.]HEV2344305.1 hypothetical protein [Actinocrinis sp.]
MYRSLGNAGGAGGALAVTGAPNVAVFLAVALALVVTGACLLRNATVLQRPGR